KTGENRIAVKQQPIRFRILELAASESPQLKALARIVIFKRRFVNARQIAREKTHVGGQSKSPVSFSTSDVSNGIEEGRVSLQEGIKAAAVESEHQHILPGPISIQRRDCACFIRRYSHGKSAFCETSNRRFYCCRFPR